MAYKRLRPYKEVMGFADGYITIFKGDTYNSIDWFRLNKARYCKLWGWYFMSDIILPNDIPEELTALKLSWDDVAIDDNTLKDEKEIAAIIDNLIYEPGVSEWVGEVGDKVDVILTVIKAVQFDGAYGRNTLHTFVDECGNQYVWSTSAKTLEENAIYRVKGGIKALDTYHNTKQTVLTRCRCTLIGG